MATYKFASYRETTYYVRTYCQLFRSERCGISRNPRLTTTFVDESDGVHGRVRAAAGLCFVLAAQATKLLLPASLKLGERRKPKKRHARNSDGDADIKVLSVSPVLWVDRSVLVRFGRSSWLDNWACDRHDFFEAPPPGYAVLWSIGLCAAVSPVATR